MGNQKIAESFDLRGAIYGRVGVLDVTSTATYIDLTAASNSIPAGLANDATAGATLRFVADGCDVYVVFSDATAPAIDDTAVTGDILAARAAMLPEGEAGDMAIAYKGNTCYKYLHYKSAADRSGVLRIWRATGDPELTY